LHIENAVGQRWAGWHGNGKKSRRICQTAKPKKKFKERGHRTVNTDPEAKQVIVI